MNLKCVCVCVFPAHLSSSVHHSMSSFPFIRTGKCWSFPCLMELERVVMVRTFPNYNTKMHSSKTCKQAALLHVRSIRRLQSVFCGYQTFATLPCSRQSCSSSLSIPDAHRGLRQGGGVTSGLTWTRCMCVVSQEKPWLKHVSEFVLVPVHARQVSPEVSRAVSSRDLDGVNHHGVTLQNESRRDLEHKKQHLK